MINTVIKSDVNSIKEELFKDTPHHLIAEIISKHNPNMRITNKLVESYLDMANSKEFTLDKTVNEIRKLNKFESTFSDKVMYELQDGNTVCVNNSTLLKLQEHINNTNIVEFMQKNVENFKGVVDSLEE